MPVIHLGPDPLAGRTPVRKSRADLSIACETGEGLRALEAAMRPRLAGAAGRIAERRDWVAARKPAPAEDAPEPGAALTKADVGRCLSEALGDADATVLSELGVPLSSLRLGRHDAWRQEPCAGGLGWSLPCAMGMQLSQPDRIIAATMGDGSYIFANPVACHQIIEALALPVLTVILNNGEWGAVRQSVEGLYPDGFAARANQMPLTGLAPVPDFKRIAKASRIWARRVREPGKLSEAMDKAVRRVRDERRPALLDITVSG